MIDRVWVLRQTVQAYFHISKSPGGSMSRWLIGKYLPPPSCLSCNTESLLSRSVSPYGSLWSLIYRTQLRFDSLYSPRGSVGFLLKAPQTKSKNVWNWMFAFLWNQLLKCRLKCGWSFVFVLRKRQSQQRCLSLVFFLFSVQINELAKEWLEFYPCGYLIRISTKMQ